MINSKKIVWTKHSLRKMRYYKLSKQRIKRVLRAYERKEEGIAPNTSALMQRIGSRKHPKEIWLMYQIKTNKEQNFIKIISAWRYPGISPQGQPPVEKDDLDFLLRL